MKVYKIRNKDGLYSTGGSRPRWNKEGKTWSSMARVKTHLLQRVIKYSAQFLIPNDWEIVEAEITITDKDVKNARLEILEHMKQKLPKLSPYRRESYEKILKNERYL